MPRNPQKCAVNPLCMCAEAGGKTSGHFHSGANLCHGPRHRLPSANTAIVAGAAGSAAASSQSMKPADACTASVHSAAAHDSALFAAVATATAAECGTNNNLSTEKSHKAGAHAPLSCKRSLKDRVSVADAAAQPLAALAHDVSSPEAGHKTAEARNATAHKCVHGLIPAPQHAAGNVAAAQPAGAEMGTVTDADAREAAAADNALSHEGTSWAANGSNAHTMKSVGVPEAEQLACSSPDWALESRLTSQQAQSSAALAAVQHTDQTATVQAASQQHYEEERPASWLPGGLPADVTAQQAGGAAKLACSQRTQASHCAQDFSTSSLPDATAAHDASVGARHVPVRQSSTAWPQHDVAGSASGVLDAVNRACSQAQVQPNDQGAPAMLPAAMLKTDVAEGGDPGVKAGLAHVSGSRAGLAKQPSAVHAVQRRGTHPCVPANRTIRRNTEAGAASTAVPFADRQSVWRKVHCTAKLRDQKTCQNQAGASRL